MTREQRIAMLKTELEQNQAPEQRNAGTVVLDVLIFRKDISQVGLQAGVPRGGAPGDVFFSHLPASPSAHGLVRGIDHDEPPSGSLRDRMPRLMATDELGRIRDEI
ncbi:hypothetical protein DL764_010042 [Monosporascus ibericus]|uniref:Uncharacterized protein n=1 Tax=Monosporascus ibericus TaxID=155417 RepID=A0A4Q4SW89_9PEZI|nr:hypothetical protein DL764_010042 [Monosporascus ibericus]